MRLFILIQAILCSVSSFTQGEDNYWYFGDYAGLSFNTTPPTVLTDGGLSSLEAVDTVSDAHGNLLFYTSGYRVWNKNHEIMPNGTDLNGSENSTCVAIVKKPGSENIYYIFTIGDDFGETLGEDIGLEYSIVNMSLDSGNGDVTEKNIEIRENVFEKILIVPHANGLDYWIVCFENLSGSQDYFYSYLLTSEGILESAVESAVDINKSPSGARTGDIVLNSNLDSFAVAFSQHGIGTFDVNSEDGSIDLLWSFEDFPTYGVNLNPKVYGVEFSESSKYLYVSHRINFNEVAIYQIDLENPPESVEDLIIVGEFQSISPAQVQMSPDGKIYIAEYQSEYLHVIHFPNLPDSTCNLELDAVFLEGELSRFGLPPRKNYSKQSPIQIENTCLGDSTFFEISGLSSSIVSIEWDFNDPMSLDNISYEIQPTHVYSFVGTYYPEVTIFTEDSEYPLSIELIIEESPDLSFLSDQVLCSENDSIILSHPLEVESVLWNDSITSESLVIDEVGTYTFQANNFGCISESSFEVIQEVCDLYLFDLYPNPANEKVRINFAIPDEYESYGLMFHDSAGRLVKEVRLSGFNSTYEFSIGELSSGIYSVSFEIEGSILKTKPLLITK